MCVCSWTDGEVLTALCDSVAPGVMDAVDGKDGTDAADPVERVRVAMEAAQVTKSRCRAR